MRIVVRCWLMLLMFALPITVRADTSDLRIITQFSSVQDTIYYDSEVQGSSVLLVVKWKLVNPPADYKLSFVQVMHDGSIFPLRVLNPDVTSDSPSTTTLQSTIDACVGGAACAYDEMIYLRMIVSDVNNTPIESQDAFVRVSYYSIANQHTSPPAPNPIAGWSTPFVLW